MSIDEDGTDSSEFPDGADLLTRLENYYDTVPRLSSTTVDIGPFALFVAQSGWPSYARPQVGASTEVTIDAVHAVLDRQRELNVPCALEWVAENSPHLESVVSAAGMRIERCPLLVLRGQPRGDPGLARMLGTGDVDDLAKSQAAVGVAFRVGGTGIGPEGAAERDAACLSAGPLDSNTVAELESGRMRAAAAYADDPTVGPVGGGRQNVIGVTSEITGVAVLPAFRGHGLAAALSHVLASDALALGASTVFCSAQNDVVARIYRKIGFRRFATACIATR